MNNPQVKSIILNFKKSNSDTNNSDTSNNDKRLSLTYITSHNDTATVNNMEVEYPEEVINSYNKWKKSYKEFIPLLHDTKTKDSKPQSTDTTEYQKSQSLEEREIEVKQNFQDCINKLNTWFRQINIDDKLKLSLEKAINQELKSAQKNKVIISSDDEQLQKLLWHRLMKIDDNNNHGNNTGVILAIPNTDNLNIDHKPNIIEKHLKVLVIYGDGAKEELNGDQEHGEWKKWEAEINDSFSTSIVKVEKTPESYDDLIKKFKEEKWDIIYFTGHGSDYPLSYYEPDKQDETNYYQMIKICDKYVPLTDFRHILTQNNPNLRLVILNCCDGLELGKELLKGGIHQVICMRETITQPTAHNFLKTFLEEFKKEPCLHITLNKTQIRLSVENANDVALGSCSIIALLQNPSAQHLEWHPPYDHSPINAVHNFISKFSTRTITIFTAILIVCCTSAGFLLHFLLTESLKSPRQAKALSYTFDICLVDDKNKNGTKKENCETGYFLHKEINKNNKEINKNDTPPPKFTYQAVVPPSSIEKIQQGKNFKIYTEKGEENGKINLHDYSVLNDKPDYLTLSFPSNNDYEFPDFNPKELFEIFSKKQKNIRLIAENIILVYKIDKTSQQDFDHSIGVLIGKLQNTQNTVNDKKFVYFGYILDPELKQFITNNSTNNFEIHTLKDEKFTNKGPITDENKYEMVFEYHLIEDKNMIWFKFSSNENYDCPEALNNAQDLESIARNYELYSKKSKNNQNQEKY
jgi:hypothetical protein